MQRIFRCALGALLLGGFLLAPSAAHAVDSCDATVVDEAHVLNVAQIETEAKKLESLGAVVRVRSFNTAPMGSLDAYREAQVQNCASWRGADGQPTGKLALFTFTVNDRKSNVYTGIDWAGKMDSEINRIRNEEMNPKLGAKQYTDGVLVAMTEVHRVITDEGSGISRAAVMWIAYIVGGLVTALVLIFGCLYWRRRVIQRREAQAEAMVAYNAAAEAFNRINSLRTEMTGVLVDKATMGLEEKMTDALRRSLAAATDLVTAAYKANEPLSDESSAMNPEGKHSRVEYDAIAKAHADVAAKATEAATALDAIEINCGVIEQLIATMDSAAVTLRDQATALIERRAKLQTKGYKVPLDEQFASLDQNITAMFKFTEADKPGQALDERVAAEAFAVEIDEQLTWLSKIRGDLQGRHQKLNERCLELSGDTGVAAATYHRLEEDYNPVCFEDVKQLVPNNKSMLKEAADLLDLAVAATSMETQDWNQATDLLNQVESLCNQVKQNCVAVSACERELTQLAVRTLSDADALSGQIDRARQKVAGFKGSQSGYTNSLAGLKRSAEDLRQRVRQNKPDYRTLSQECADLEEEIRSTLSRAQSEHQRVEDEERRERERLAQAERARQAAASASSSSYSSGGGGGYDGGSNSSGSY